MSILPAYMRVFHIYVSLVPMECTGCPGTEVTNGYEGPCGWGTEPRFLELLTTKTSLRPSEILIFEHQKIKAKANHNLAGKLTLHFSF